MELCRFVKSLKEALNCAKDDMKKFKTSNPVVENQDILRSFTSNISSVLDYSFNDYPNHDNDFYYPRPEINENKFDYVERLRVIKTKEKNTMNDSLHNFLLYVFEVNTNYRQAISLLPTGSKHKIGKTAEIVEQSDLQYSPTTTDDKKAIQENEDGSIDIPGIMHAEKGANIIAKKMTIITPDGTTKFPDFQFHPNNGVVKLKCGVERDATSWMSDCISVCEKLIQRIEKKS